MRSPLRLVWREPDFLVGGAADPYMRRWHVIPRNRRFNVYLHHFRRSDDDRALHDHPWWNVSLLLRGSYLEHMPGGQLAVRRPWRLISRPAEAAHRIELFSGPDGRPLPVWTVFITGRRVREWGFHCPRGWRHWRDFTSPHNKGEVGRGCE